MISKKQRDWLCQKCDTLLIYADDYSMPEDVNWETLIGMTDKYAQQAHGNKIVTKGLMLTVDYVDAMYKLMRDGV